MTCFKQETYLSKFIFFFYSYIMYTHLIKNVVILDVISKFYNTFVAVRRKDEHRRAESRRE